MLRSSVRTFTLALLAASAFTAPALAQQNQENARAEDGRDSEGGSEDEIVVYGRGVEANAAATGLELTPRETPQSLSIITREQIEDQGAANVTQVLGYTTGVSVKSVDRGRNTLSARGFEITNFQIDGMPFATGNIGLEESSTALYERVEVVRGATGLLQGAGEPSASVNLVRKHADADEFTGELNFEVGSWDRYAGMVDLGAPLTANGAVRGRFVVEAYSQDAFVDLESTNGYTFYGVIDADLGPNTRLSAGLSHQRDERSGIAWVQLPYWYNDGTRTDWDRSKTTAADWNQWDTTEQTAFLTIAHDINADWSLRGGVSYHRQEEESKLIWMYEGATGLDPATGEGMEAWPYWYHTEPEQWNANLQANGAYDLFGRRHEVVLGAMHSHLDSGWTNREPDPASVAPVGDFREWDGDYPEAVWGPRFRLSGFGTTEQSALYGATRLHLLEPLRVIVGARLSSYRFDEEVSMYNPEAYTLEHDSVVTPYAGVIYDFSDTLSAYASYTSIFNPQTAQDRYGDYLDPLEGDNYEVGLKADLLDGRLRTSAAIFRIEQNNFPVIDGDYTVPGTQTPASRAAQGTVSEGYELEMQGEVSPGWDVSVGWSQFEAEDADGIDVQAHHPRRVFRLSTKYVLPGDFDRWSIGGSARWESQPPQTATRPDPDPNVIVVENVGQPAYWLVNLLASYELNERTSLQLNVDNVFDETYYNNNAWFGGVLYGEPRNARVTLRYEF